MHSIYFILDSVNINKLYISVCILFAFPFIGKCQTFKEQDFKSIENYRLDMMTLRKPTKKESKYCGEENPFYLALIEERTLLNNRIDSVINIIKSNNYNKSDTLCYLIIKEYWNMEQPGREFIVSKKHRFYDLKVDCDCIPLKLLHFNVDWDKIYMKSFR